MSFETAGYQLAPVLPELVLAIGAMALLMLGAYRGEGTTRLVTTLSILLLIATGVLELMLPAGKLTTFAGSSKYQLVIDTLEPAGVGAGPQGVPGPHFTRRPSRGTLCRNVWHGPRGGPFG